MQPDATGGVWTSLGMSGQVPEPFGLRQVLAGHPCRAPMVKLTAGQGLM